MGIKLDGEPTAIELGKFLEELNKNKVESSPRDPNISKEKCKFVGFLHFKKGQVLWNGTYSEEGETPKMTISKSPQKLGDGYYLSSQKEMAVDYANYAASKKDNRKAVLFKAQIKKPFFAPIVEYCPDYWNKPLTEFLKTKDCPFVTDELYNEIGIGGFKIAQLISEKNEKQANAIELRARKYQPKVSPESDVWENYNPEKQLIELVLLNNTGNWVLFSVHDKN